MLNEEYLDTDNPFGEKPSSVHPAIMGSFIDEEDKNDDRIDHDDLQFTKDLAALINNQSRVTDKPQEIASNCQVQDLIDTGLI